MFTIDILAAFVAFYVTAVVFISCLGSWSALSLRLAGITKENRDTASVKQHLILLIVSLVGLGLNVIASAKVAVVVYVGFAA